MKNKAQEIYLWRACHLEALRALSLILKHLKLPLQAKPQHMICLRNKPIKMRILTISPFGYFVTKPPIALILTTKYKLRDIKDNLHYKEIK